MDTLLKILKLLFGIKNDSPKEVVSKIEEPPTKKELIALHDYITASGKYPERLDSPELTEEVKANATKLLGVVNQALIELGVEKAVVSSGFRPSEINAKIVGAAKRSHHQTGKAIDLVDDNNQSLCKLFTKKVLEKHGLRREDSDYTKGWCHLDIGEIKYNRIFKP